MNYITEAHSQGGEGGGLPPARFKGTKFAQNRKHAFLCYALEYMFVRMQNNLKNDKSKNEI